MGISPVMAPFSGHIYDMICWRTNLKAVIPADQLSMEFKDALRLWRCVITMMELRRDDHPFYRTFESYIPLPTKAFVIDFDASIKGAGVIVKKMEGGVWVPVRVIGLQFGAAYTAVLAGLQYRSTLQNTCEFIAALIGLACAITYGARDGAIQPGGQQDCAPLGRDVEVQLGPEQQCGYASFTSRWASSTTCAWTIPCSSRGWTTKCAIWVSTTAFTALGPCRLRYPRRG